MLRKVRDYRLIRRLEGTGSDVFVADKGGAERFVVASFEMGPEEARGLERQLERCVSLPSAHLTRAIEVFEHEGRQTIVFEGVAGVSLARLLCHLERDGARLSDEAILKLGLGLCRGLAAAHDARDASGRIVPLVHAQLGLDQVFVSWKGEVKMLSIGLSAAFRFGSGLICDGSDPYAAPEVRGRGALTVRGNTYTAGAILWSLFTGLKPPLSGRAAPLRTHRPELDERLSDSIDRALEPLLVERTVTCADLARAIERLEGAEGSDLERQMAMLATRDGFEESTSGAASHPPTRSPELPPSSVAELAAWPPDSDAFIRTEIFTLPASAADQKTMKISRQPLRPIRRGAGRGDKSTLRSMPAVGAPSPLEQGERLSAPLPVEIAVEVAPSSHPPPQDESAARAPAGPDEAAALGAPGTSYDSGAEADEAISVIMSEVESASPQRAEEPLSRGATPAEGAVDPSPEDAPAPAKLDRRLALPAAAFALVVAFLLGLWMGSRGPEAAAAPECPSEEPSPEAADAARLVPPARAHSSAPTEPRPQSTSGERAIHQPQLPRSFAEPVSKERRLRAR